MTRQESILPSAWSVPDAFRRRLGEDVGRQRSMFHDGVTCCSSFTTHGGRRTWSASVVSPGQTAMDKHLDAYQPAIDRLDTQEAAALNPLRRPQAAVGRRSGPQNLPRFERIQVKADSVLPCSRWGNRRLSSLMHASELQLTLAESYQTRNKGIEEYAEPNLVANG